MKAFTATVLVFASIAAARPDTVVVDLAGVQIKDGRNESRSSAPATIDPALRYTYSLDGLAEGNSGALAVLFPDPTPLADVLEALSPGSSAYLSGMACNGSEMHPFEVLGQTFEGETEIIGITVTFSATFSAGIDAGGVAYFSLTNVDISPSFLVGSMTITSGAATINRVTCPADLTGEGTLNIFDFLEFQTGFSDEDPLADFNCDGLYNVFDFLRYLTEFSEGC